MELIIALLLRFLFDLGYVIISNLLLIPLSLTHKTLFFLHDT